MPRINIRPDCGNSPRKVFLKDFYIAMANGNIEILCDNVNDELTWQVAGQHQVSGKENYLKALPETKMWKVQSITIDAIITHGRDAAVAGHIQAADSKQYAFCDIYQFKGAGGTTIHSITTFLVEEGESNFKQRKV